MIKIEGDYQYIDVAMIQDYNNRSSGVPGIKVTITLKPEFVSLIHDFKIIRDEWRAEKTAISTSPTVKYAYDQYQLALKLDQEKQ